jgi:DNA polymerase III subunit epsilon
MTQQHWVHGPLVSYDLETDGVDPGDARIIQAALILRAPDRRPVIRTWLARPVRPIPEAATTVHGITSEQAAAHGADPAQVVAEIRDALAEWWSPECPLVICNAPYDLTVLDRELERHHGDDLTLGGPVLDPLLLDRRADKWRPGERKLVALAAHYGVGLEEGAAHDATADAVAALRVMMALGARRRWPPGKFGRADESERQARRLLAEGCAHALYEAQPAWYRDSALSLAQYWRTPNAPAKLRERAVRGELTAEECVELIRTLEERAAEVERHAGGWPLRPRVATVVGG